MSEPSGRMRLCVRVHRVGSALRLVTPASPLRGTHVTNLLWRHTGALVGSRADLLRLGALFRLAAVSARTAVFLPLRGNAASLPVRTWCREQGLADLVVARRDVPLRPSAWPGLRARTRRGPGTPATVRAPAARPPRAERSWDRARHELSVAEHAGTLFLSGTARALFEAGDELTWCGDEVAGHPDIHRHGGPTLLSQFDGPGQRPGRRDATWECMVLAEDPIFHRVRWAQK